MARKRRWIKLNEKFKTLDEYLEIKRNLINEIKSLGYDEEIFNNEKGVYFNLYSVKISGGLSSITDKYKDAESSIERINSKINTTYVLRLTIDLNLM